MMQVNNMFNQINVFFLQQEGYIFCLKLFWSTSSVMVKLCSRIREQCQNKFTTFEHKVWLKNVTDGYETCLRVFINSNNSGIGGKPPTLVQNNFTP